MIPIHDLNPTQRTPIFTWLILAINIVVFLWEQTFSPEALFQMFQQLSVVPVLAAAAPFAPETLLDVSRSIFLHGGWAHLIGNMLYLYLFADNVEDRWGRIFFLVLYFASGYVAAMAQVLIDPTSEIPLVGASGAIAGVLGSYLVLYPGVRVRGIIPLGFFSTITDWPAWGVLALWFVLQLFNGLASLGAPMGSQGGVAFFAHIGGFVCGMLLTWIFMLIMPQPRADQRRQMLYERAGRYRF